MPPGHVLTAPRSPRCEHVQDDFPAAEVRDRSRPPVGKLRQCQLGKWPSNFECNRRSPLPVAGNGKPECARSQRTYRHKHPRSSADVRPGVLLRGPSRAVATVSIQRPDAHCSGCGRLGVQQPHEIAETAPEPFKRLYHRLQSPSGWIKRVVADRVPLRIFLTEGHRNCEDPHRSA